MILRLFSRRNFIPVLMGWLAMGGCLIVGNPARSVEPASTSQIYWFQVGSVGHANLDGSNVASVIPQSGSDLVIDSRTGILYWTHGGGVDHWDPREKTPTTLFQFTGFSGGAGIALDDLRNHVYFVEYVTSTIYRSDLDGGNPAIIVPSDGMVSNVHRISRLGIDPFGEKLYWTNAQSGAFVRSNLDGSQQEELFTPSGFISRFEIDPFNNKVYWAKWGTDRGEGTVYRANLDGNNQETLISNLWNGTGLALDLEAGKMYVSDSATISPTDYHGTILSANLDGTMVRTIVNFGPGGRAWAVAIGPKLIPEPRSVALLLSGLLLGMGIRTPHAYRVACSNF